MVKGIERYIEATERYTDLEPLGSGGMGVVYRVWDAQLERKVALKTLGSLSPGQIHVLKEEFRALADLSHPNLIEIYDLVVDERVSFYTMELISGVDFDAWLRGDAERVALVTAETLEATGSPLVTLARPPSPHPTLLTPPARATPTPKLVRSAMSRFEVRDLRRIKGAVAMLAQGLKVLHDAGKLHRDVKASNIMVTTAGRVVLLDFGLVAALNPEDRANALGFAGTPAYMSPEQATDGPLTAASDWYSVGVTLFEALTGQLPFNGHMFSIMRDKLIAPAPTLASLCPAAPPGLAALIAGLLERDPERRAGYEAVQAWTASANDSASAGLSRAGGVGRSTQMQTASVAALARVFVGRQRELDLLSRALSVTHEGVPIVVSVQGSSGMGKSELLRRFLSPLGRDPDTWVLRGRCHPREAVAYKALDGVIDALSSHLGGLPPKAANDLLPMGELPALVRLFPSLERVEAVQRALMFLPPAQGSLQEIQQQGFEGLKGLLKRLSTRRRLVIWIDDLQWGDLDSVRLLQSLLLPPSPPVMLLLLSYRSEDRSHSEVLRALFDAGGLSWPSEWFRELEVKPLEEAESRALIEDITAHLELPEDIDADAILRDANGSPFWLRELLQGLASHTPEPGQAFRLEDVVHWRVATLAPPERVLLELVSVSVQPLEQTLLRQIDVVGPGAMVEIQRLRKQCFVRTTHKGEAVFVETYHDKIAEAVVGRLTDEARQQRHSQLARVLLAQERPDPLALVHHLEAAGERRQAGQWALQAAERAAGALAFELAANLYGKVVGFNDDPERVAALQEALGEALGNCGRGQAAGQAFEAAAAEIEGRGASDPKALLSLRQRAAEQYLRSGHAEEGTALMATVLEGVGVKIPRSPGLTIASVLYQRARLKLRGLDFALKEGAVDPEVLQRFDVCWSASTSFSTIDPMLGHALAVRGLRDALDMGERSRIVRALAFEANFKATLGGAARVRESDALLERVGALAQEGGRPYDRAWVLMATGTSTYMEVHWERSVEALERAIAIFREECTGVSWEISNCQSFINTALARMGRLAEMRERLPHNIRDARARGDLLAELGLPLGVPNMVWLADGDSRRAREIADGALVRWTGKGTHLVHYLHLMAAVQADLYDGEGASAWARVERTLPQLKAAGFFRMENSRVDLWDLRARAALAQAAVGPPSARRGALALCGKLARDIRAVGSPWAAPLAAGIEAGVAHLSGDEVAAVERLESALAGFVEVPMGLHGAAARYWLGALKGGQEGAQARQEAEAAMRAQTITAPESMAAMLLPGFARPGA